jgi:hypothetical protein
MILEQCLKLSVKDAEHDSLLSEIGAEGYAEGMMRTAILLSANAGQDNSKCIEGGGMNQDNYGTCEACQRLEDEGIKLSLIAFLIWQRKEAGRVTNKKERKKSIKYTFNIDTLLIGSRKYYEQYTLEGRATEHERDCTKVLANPTRKRGRR